MLLSYFEPILQYKAFIARKIGRVRDNKGRKTRRSLYSIPHIYIDWSTSSASVWVEWPGLVTVANEWLKVASTFPLLSGFSVRLLSVTQFPLTWYRFAPNQ